MADETGGDAPTIEGNMLFYKQPELLNVQAHGKLGITPTSEQPFAFLRETQIVPITVAEFGLAALNYPIVFAGEERTPAAVMGMKQDHNIFVTEDGKMIDGIYVPAFVRRYPFASAKNSEDPNNLMICIDRSSKMVCENSDSPFFDGEKLTDMTSQAIEFVKAYEGETVGTQNFARAMKEMDMFADEDVMLPGAADADGKPTVQKMGSYVGISEEKLAKLSPEKLVELRDNGALGAIYAHRMSQANWQRLLNMEIARDMKDQQNGGQA